LTNPIASRAGAREIIEKYGLNAHKKLGQHFLVDPFVLDKIIRAANLTGEDCVLEIGPGIGAVTQALAEAAGTVLAVELDAVLAPLLQTLFAGGNVTIHHGDILRTDLRGLLAPYAGMPLKVVANLPYYVTTPVIMHLFESGVNFKSFTVMVQKEVALRMAAGPGSKDYGALSLAVQYYADVRLAANVPPNCFMPRPNVDSAVVHMDVLSAPRVGGDKEWLFKVIRAAFNQRRKTLVNALNAPSGVGMPKEKVQAALAACGLREDVRGETLTLEGFARVAGELGE
jgi:16S rRNA (adenine1518-N6/adenine1519-N6)-dimethyltransferase